MPWGTDLWDQYDAILKYEQHGIAFLEHLTKFYQERLKLEKEYAKNTKNLCLKYNIQKLAGGRGSTDLDYSYRIAFQKILDEVNCSALQHDRIAEGFDDGVVKPSTLVVTELKKEVKIFTQTGQQLEKQLKNLQHALETAFKKYSSSHADMLKAQEAFKKASDDRTLSRLDVDKSRHIADTKKSDYDRAKQDYAKQHQAMNEYEELHYTDKLPKALEQIEEFDKNRTTRIAELLHSSTQAENCILKSLESCFDTMTSAVKLINADNDAALVVDSLKTGETIPGDYVFVDLDSTDTSSTGGGENSLRRVSSSNGGVTVGTLKSLVKKPEKMARLFKKSKPSSKPVVEEDCSHLPVEQQKKQLRKNLAQKKEEVSKATKSRDAMAKMVTLYDGNPKLGNANDTRLKLEAENAELSKLMQEESQIENYLAIAEGRPPGSCAVINVSTTSTSNVAMLTKFDDDEFAEDSTESYINDFQSPPPGPAICNSSLPNNIIGSAVALYAYDVDESGFLSFAEGDKFDVVSADNGDGWTYVQGTQNSQIQGYVPTSYIKIS